MNWPMRVAPALGLALLASCAGQPSKPAPSSIRLEHDAIVVEGELRPNTLARMQEAIGQRKVSKLIIRSGGGEVTGSIKVARWVHENGIDVEVDGDCFSSCANYIFPAGRNKYIVGKGIVAWHGTLEHQAYKHEQGDSQLDAESLASLLSIVARERKFYADTGINSFAGWFGKIAPYNIYNLYFMSKQDMEYFGMRNLHVRADYAQADLKKYLKFDARTIRLLTVNRAVTNAADPRWPVTTANDAGR